MRIKGLERLSFDESFSGKAARTKSFIAQYVSELENRKRASLLLKKGFKIIICVPLIIMDEVGGVMNLATGKDYELNQEKIDLFVTIGNQMAMAINNAKLYEELKDRIESLKGKNEIIKYFAYSVSHDLKSPATGIYGLTKRLKGKYGQVLGEKGNQHCDQIMKAAKQMLDLLEMIKSIIVTKELPLKLEKVNVKEITATLRTEFSSRLRNRNIRWTEPDTFPGIIVDKLALLRVFRNLIENSLKYGGKDMLELKMGYRGNDDFHIFSFSDDGIGIKKEDKTTIFKPFNRLDTSKRTDGSGLGLAIVKEIAERHGGNAWIDDSSGKGVTFCVSVSKALKII
jgi:signal transduction histidine kinase